MKKIMMDGEPLEVGDRVYCLLRGDGVVSDGSNVSTPLGEFLVKFGEYNFRYAYNGTPILGGMFQPVRTLYWQKPEIVPPPKLKPKKKIKVWDWYLEYDDGDVFRENEKTEQWVYESTPTTKKTQKIDGTEREIEVYE